MIGQLMIQEPGTVNEGPEDPTRAQKIERQIEHRASGRIYDLRVDCFGDKVVLQGRCRTYHAKQLAHEAALDLAESSARLVNQIVVG